MLKPLAIWPSHVAYTPAAERRRSQFGVDHAGDVSPVAARTFLIDELERLGATDIVVAVCMPEGAVWFRLGGQLRVLCCDRWLTLGENLRALGLTAQAMRGLERWGVSDVVGQAMSGFALPDPEGSNGARPPSAVHPVMASTVSPASTPSWRTVLGAQQLGDDLAAIKRRYRELAKIVHPDVGGREAHAARLNAAMEAAERELGHLLPAKPHTRSIT